MCGRFTITHPNEALAALFAAVPGNDLPVGPNFNVCPTNPVAVVTSDGAYPTFNYHVSGFGGVLSKVPYRDDREDPDALLARAAEVQAQRFRQ